MFDKLINPSQWAILAVAILALGACAPRVDNHGNKPEPERLAMIEPGVQSKAQVQTMLGSPSSVGAFEDDTWYYISQIGERDWFLPEEAVEREVVMIRFDDGGRVSSIEAYDIEDGREIVLVDRETPTHGQELTFFEQMVQAFVGGPGGLLNSGEGDLGDSTRY